MSRDDWGLWDEDYAHISYYRGPQPVTLGLYTVTKFLRDRVLICLTNEIKITTILMLTILNKMYVDKIIPLLMLYCITKRKDTEYTDVIEILGVGVYTTTFVLMTVINGIIPLLDVVRGISKKKRTSNRKKKELKIQFTNLKTTVLSVFE